MIDEMCPSPNDTNGSTATTDPKVNATGGRDHDWSNLKCNQENVFLLVAFNPCSPRYEYGKGSPRKFKIKTPGDAKDSHSKHEQLEKQYRCSPSIAKFADYVRSIDPGKFFTHLIL